MNRHKLTAGISNNAAECAVDLCAWILLYYEIIDDVRHAGINGDHFQSTAVSLDFSITTGRRAEASFSAQAKVSLEVEATQEKQVNSSCRISVEVTTCDFFATEYCTATKDQNLHHSAGEEWGSGHHPE